MARVLKTEAEAIAAIRRRFPPPAWVTFSHVPARTGGGSPRSADAIAMSVWKSRGLEVVGFEVKVRRSDLLRELKNPAKAEAIGRYCDRWWIVAGAASIAKPEELPPAWGLLVPHGDTLRIAKDAARLDASPLDRLFVASLLRKAYGLVDEARSQIRAEVYEEVRRECTMNAASKVESLERDLARAEERSRTLLEQFAAVKEEDLHHPEKIGKAIALLHRVTGWRGASRTLDNLSSSLERDSDRLAELAATLRAAKSLCAPLDEEPK